MAFVPKEGKFYKVDLYTGTSGLRQVKAKILKIIDDKYVEIEFDHPTVRRYKAHQVVASDRLRPLESK